MASLTSLIIYHPEARLEKFIPSTLYDPTKPSEHFIKTLPYWGPVVGWQIDAAHIQSGLEKPESALDAKICTVTSIRCIYSSLSSEYLLSVLGICRESIDSCYTMRHNQPTVEKTQRKQAPTDQNSCHSSANLVTKEATASTSITLSCNKHSFMQSIYKLVVNHLTHTCSTNIITAARRYKRIQSLCYMLVLELTHVWTQT